MSQKAITINTPADAQAHITADDDAFIHDSLLGGVSGILGELSCVRISDNTVRLSGGGASNKGYILRVPEGEHADLTVTGGSQGLCRHDIVAARFTRGTALTADTHEFVVIKGTAAVSPTDPETTASDLTAAGDVLELPLFRVKLNGTALEEIETVAPVLPSFASASQQERRFFTGAVSPEDAADGDVWFVTA